MSRTVDEIKQAMVVQKNAEAGLSGLTSTSQTAIWNLIFFICAVAIKIMEDLFDVHTDQVEERKLEIPVGVLKWYASESLIFQFGDSLVFTDTYVNSDGETITLQGKNLVYTVEDDDKKIVALAAADILNGVVIIKAAGLDGGVAKKLEDIETGGLAAFTSYWTDKRFAGTAVTIISVDPDLLKAYYNVTYDPQILANDGSLLSDALTFPVEDAIDAFLQTFQSTDFNGIMRVLNLTDAIQGAQGVVNAVATDVQGKPAAGSYVDILAISGQQYASTAGYMKIDPSFPLSGSLTYISA